MKRSTIVIYLLVFVAGGCLGFSIAMQKVYLTRDDYVRLLHADEQHQARVYLSLLQAQDSGRADDKASLRLRALTKLSYYVGEVEDLRKEGLTWAPIDGQFYSNAITYLAEHPLPK